MPYTTATALWSGFAGAPGYTRMKWNGPLNGDDMTLAANKMHTFFAAFQELIPAAVVMSWDGVGQQFDDERNLTGEVSYTPPAGLAGTGSGSWAAPVGAVVDWLTSDFVNGRRLRGRTFVVPLTTAAFQTDGTVNTAAQTEIRTAANNLIAGDPLLVINGGAPGARETRVVTGATVPDRAAVLRSRRD